MARFKMFVKQLGDKQAVCKVDAPNDDFTSEVEQLRAAIKEKRRGKFRAGVMLLQDNAPVHTAQVALATGTQCSFELLPHPFYSPLDFYLFPKLKSHLRGHHFETDVIQAVEAYLKDQDETFFQLGIGKLEH
uniref:Histone-lysine N-methyltransferase SETMAR-like n=1 Tax=Saccoglossus kowalevskii TaxID=10224 RepID=A0ABM0MV75_SACKO|nr:PREDICTED: histone-lysine N-methyltransferase SETMAR-like [Saccoglossus kowalevskii]